MEKANNQSDLLTAGMRPVHDGHENKVQQQHSAAPLKTHTHFMRSWHERCDAELVSMIA